MKKKILSRPLPPQVVSSPLSSPLKSHVRSQSQHARRVVGALLLVFGLVLAMVLLVPQPTGKVITATTVNVSQVQSVICDFPLFSGLNLVSFNCISNYENIVSVLNNTDLAKIKGVYEYQATGSDLWKVYAPNLPSYVVFDLGHLSREKAYAIVLFNNVSDDGVYYDGFLSSETNMYLYNGFNLAGYPSENASALPAGLTTINESYELIRTYNQSNGWIEYVNGSGGGLQNLTPTEGYWVKVAYDDIWTVQR